MDVNELVERYPRLFHLAEAGSAPAISQQTPLRAHILDKALTDMTARQWLSALNERVFFWLHSQRPAQSRPAARHPGRRHRQHGQRSRPPHPAVGDQHVIDVYRRVA